VGGHNFGQGSSREHAALVIKLNGSRPSWQRALQGSFIGNCFNNGLPRSSAIRTGLKKGMSWNSSWRREDHEPHERRNPHFSPRSSRDERILDDGGLVEHVKKYKDLKLV